MAIDIDQFSRLKKRAEKAKSECDKAEGVLDEQKKKLKADFDVDTIAAAEELLKKLEEEEAEAETNYKKALAEFELQWGEKV